MQPIIKWTGSKRLVVKELNNLLPPDSYSICYEPFVGGGSFSYYQYKKQAFCSDIIPHVINLWLEIQNKPEKLFYNYQKHWMNFKKVGKDYYFEIRDKFNQSHRPEDFFFINRLCVGGLIRFNQKGEFNASLGYGRNGIKPENLEPILYKWSKIIKNYKYKTKSYLDINPTDDSFVFCDPPYETNESMYFGSFDYGEFQEWLMKLNNQDIKWMVTTRTELDNSLYQYRTNTSGGNSTFKNLGERKQKTVKEYIYINYQPKKKQ